MAWTTVSFSFGSVLTSTKMTQIQDNFTAVAQGLSGAPKILADALNQAAGSEAVVTAAIRDLAVTDAKLSISAITTDKIGAAAVTQSKLSTTTGEVSGADAAVSTVTLPGGTYGFFPQLKGTASQLYGAALAGHLDISVAGNAIPSVLTTGYVTNLALSVFTGGGSALYAQQRYIQASPPYDLGDGEIPLFIFVLVENGTGRVLATYSAPEAPWHYNGPTDIRADRYGADRRGYRMVKQFFAEHGSIRAARQAGMTRDQIAQAIANSPLVEVEITQAIKNADMPLLPHPFLSNDLTGKTVVLLDPVSPFVDRASRLQEGGESLCELLHSGGIIIGNTDLPRNKPSGVLAVAPRWSLT